MSCRFGKSCPWGSSTPWDNPVQACFAFTLEPWLSERKTFRSSSYCANIQTPASYLPALYRDTSCLTFISCKE